MIHLSHHIGAHNGTIGHDKDDREGGDRHDHDDHDGGTSHDSDDEDGGERYDNDDRDNAPGLLRLGYGWEVSAGTHNENKWPNLLKG